MTLFERIISKELQDFQNLTTEDQERILKLFKHKCIALWLTRMFMYSIIPRLIALAICIISIVLNIFAKVAVALISFYITMFIALVMVNIEIVVFYKIKRKKQTTKEVSDWFIEKIQNLWLLNKGVISFKDWKIIKKRNKLLYDKARSEDCNHECYFTTYAIANTLQNPEIKILWVSIDSTDHRCGHSVLVRNDKIYDSNLRRTYNREEYLKAFKTEVFKEYSIEEYMGRAKIQEKHFICLDWGTFGEWCREHNVVRNT